MSWVKSIAATRNPSKEVSKPKSLEILSDVFKSRSDAQIRYAKETFFNVYSIPMALSATEWMSFNDKKKNFRVELSIRVCKLRNIN